MKPQHDSAEAVNDGESMVPDAPAEQDGGVSKEEADVPVSREPVMENASAEEGVGGVPHTAEVPEVKKSEGSASNMVVAEEDPGPRRSGRVRKPMQIVASGTTRSK
jgi:hypothetical protein